MLSTRPIEFPKWLGERAAGGPPTRALIAGAHVAHALEGVRLATEAGWLEPVLVGPGAGILAAADEIGWDVSGVERTEADGEEAVGETVASLAGDASVGMVVKGHIHTNVLLGALLRAKPGIRTGGRLLHVWLLTHPEFDRPLAISDGALNLRLDVEIGKSILEALVDVFAAVGRPRPRVALLAASEEVLPGMPATVLARKLVEWSRSAGIDADAFGPVAMDGAISPEAARIKSLPDPAGLADALVVPTVEVGNVLAKTLIWFRSVCAAGVVLGGRIPVTITSRSDAPAARLASVALARILAERGVGGSR